MSKILQENIGKNLQIGGGTSQYDENRQRENVHFDTYSSDELTTLKKEMKSRRLRHVYRRSLMEQMKSLVHQSMKNRIVRKASFVMAGIVVFTTTYSLILPALTLDYDSLSDLPGLHLGQKPVVVEVLNSEISTAQDGRDFLSSGTVSDASSTGEAEAVASGGVSKGTDEEGTVSAADQTISDTDQSVNDTANASEMKSVDNVRDTHKELLWVDRDADQAEIDQAVDDTFGDQAVKDQEAQPADQKSKEKELSIAEDQPESENQTNHNQNAEKEMAADITEDQQTVVAPSESINPPVADASAMNTPEQVEPSTVPEELEETKSENDDTVADQNATNSNATNEINEVETQNPSEEVAENESVNNIENSTTTETGESVDTTEPTEKPETWLQNTANTVLNQNTMELTFDGADYHVIATGVAGTAIPEGAVLDVQEIVQGTSEYRDYEESAKEHLSDPNAEVISQRFFDIRFLVDGVKVEPTEGVTVQIRFDEAQEVKEDQKLSVVHFFDKDTGFEERAAEISETRDNNMESLTETTKTEKTVESEKNTGAKTEVAEILKPVSSITDEGMIESISFKTNSFSVYGVIVGEGGGLPDDLNGVTVKIGNGSNYLTGETNYNATPWRINKTNNVNGAADYTFEATGTPGVYNIYTYVNGQRHDLHINKYDGNRADVNLTTSGTMGLTVTKNANGTYGISRTIDGTTYYLNQYGGNGGNGFAGWKGDNDGNSKLKFVTGQPSTVTDGGKYMVLIKRVEDIEGEDVDVFYIVNNDGTLTPVRTELNTDGSVKCVYVDEPMLWTYANNHLYHNYDAYSFDMNSAPEEFLFRYLNPGSNDGLATENKSQVHRYWDNNSYSWHTDRDLWNSSTAIYDLEHHRIGNGLVYLGTEVGEDGVLRVSGNKDVQNAAEVYFAVASKVKPPQQAVNAVNHIDISIVGTSVVDVPLAYGNYYNASGGLVYTVSKDNKKTIEASSPVDITIDDMKRAMITAYQIDRDGTVRNLDDAFYITGYSKNKSTEFSTDQVRIEGSFRTANTMHGEDLNAFDDATNTYKNRLDNRVYYTVTVTKPVTFTLKDEDGNDLYDADGKKMEITIDISMAASFDYWNEHNECPPLQDHLTVFGQQVNNETNHVEWRRGGYTTYDGITGMDFVLGGNAEDAGSNIVALEISKLIVDKDGERIKLADSEDITNTFHVYRDADGDPDSVNGLDVNEYTTAANYQGYSKLHDKNVKVSSDGMGVVYDYDVTPGMFYVREDKDSIPDTITDDKGETWYFAGTRIETEYVWRDQPEYDNGLHISDTYTKDGSSDFNSIPEVLGPYTDSKGRTTHYNQETQQEEPLRNGFLEFFVYNIYTKTGDVTFTKTNGSGTNLQGAVFGLYKKYDMETGEVSDPLTSNGIPVTATSGADGVVKFSDIPAVNYYMKEISAPEGYVLNPKVYLVSVGDKTDPDSHTYIFAADGTPVTEIINYPSPDNPDAQSAQVENHKRIDALRDGAANPDSPHAGEDLTDLYRLYLDYKIKTVQDPKGVDLLFVLDHSGSMNSRQSGGDPRRAPTIEQMLNGNDGLIKQFLDMNENNRWAAVGFFGPSGVHYLDDITYRSQNAGESDSEILSEQESWRTDKYSIQLPLAEGTVYKRVGLVYVPIAMGPTMLTDYTAGFWRAEQFLKNNDGRKKVVIFISDGLPTLYIPCSGTLEGADQTYGSAYYPAEIGGCVDETLTQFGNFLTDVNGYGYKFGENIDLYTVGFGYDLLGGGGQTILDNMLSAAYAGTEVNVSDHSFGFDDGDVVSTAAAIKQALGGAIGLGESFSNIAISDKLSQYVDIYGLSEEVTNSTEILKAAGTKVTMTDPSDLSKTITLYENGAITAAGSNILGSVSYNSDKTVTAIFKSDYKALPGITYTLSFDVKATDEAYKEYAKKGYGINVGDLDTDFQGITPANATSSGKPGFKSNTSAKVSYDHEKSGSTKNEHKDYRDPVIQVFNAPIEFIKTDQDGQPVRGAEFNLYSSGFDPTKSLTDPVNIASKMNTADLVSEVMTLEDNTKVARIAAEKLKHGTYYLVETKAPDGYNSLEGPIKIEVKVASNDTVTVEASMNGESITTPMLQQTETDKNDWRLKIVNTPGTTLPATGGPGTMLMYGLGAVVAEITGYNMLCKRRKKYLNGQKHKIMKKRWS